MNKRALWKLFLGLAITTLLIWLCSCAAQKSKPPQLLSTIPPGACSVDGGKHWFKARPDGMCYPGDSTVTPSYIPCGAEVVWTDDKTGHDSTWIYPCWPQDTKPKCLKGCEAHWSPRTGDAAEIGGWPERRFPQRGEWRCPAGYTLIDTRTGKQPLLSDEWDHDLEKVMGCVKP